MSEALNLATQSLAVREEGAFFDMPANEYFSSPGVSNSMLKHLGGTEDDPGSPAHFVEQFKHRDEQTRPMLLGSLAHAKILEPNKPFPRIVIQPEEYPAPANCSAVKQKKVGVGDLIPWHGGAGYCKRWVADELAKGNTVLTRSEHDALEGMALSVANHPTARRALAAGSSEVSLFKRFYRRGEILRKARVDFASQGNALIDIKTCMDARKDSFSRTIWMMRYYVQAAYYLDLWNDLVDAGFIPEYQRKATFVFVAVEKFPPYAVSVFDVSSNALHAGREEYQRNLQLLMNCIALDYWPAYSTDTQEIDLPKRAYATTAAGVF
jgi:exodeoxyribonuclease VIII